jgi:uncharacterized protein (DUF2126 family)
MTIVEITGGMLRAARTSGHTKVGAGPIQYRWTQLLDAIYSSCRKPRNSAIATPMMAAKTISSRSNHVFVTKSPRDHCEHQQRENEEGHILQPSHHLSWLLRGHTKGSVGLFPPPALSERRHRGLARRGVAVRQRAVLSVPERPHPWRTDRRRVHLHDAADDFALAVNVKSSSLPSPEGRLAETRFRTSTLASSSAPSPRGLPEDVTRNIRGDLYSPRV